jgi:hypothetical protein
MGQTTYTEPVLNAAGQTVAEAVNKRKLVTVRSIDAIEPITGADAIEVVTIEGWKVVTKKGDFKVGDPCVYFEIDSFLPTGVPAWQFLVDKSSREFEGVVGHRLRTIKLRGQISQGLALPLFSVPQILEKLNLTSAVDPQIKADLEQFHGVDATAELKQAINKVVSLNLAGIREVDFSDTLGIKKWESPMSPELAGQAEGYFPSFIRKTDQERCQNLKAEIFGFESTKVALQTAPENITQESLDSGRVTIEDGVVYAIHQAKGDPNALYEVSIKMDGSSMTAFIRRDDEGTPTVGVCSRNLQLKLNEANDGNSFIRMAIDSGLKYALEQFFATTGRSIAVQGELMGPGIQKNREALKENYMYVFDIFDIDTGEYLAPDDRVYVYNVLRAFAEQAPGANHKLFLHTPVIASGVKLTQLGITDIASLLAYAEGPSLVNPVREGLVFKRMDGQFSFKAISNVYLEKEKD